MHIHVLLVGYSSYVGDQWSISLNNYDALYMYKGLACSYNGLHKDVKLIVRMRLIVKYGYMGKIVPLARGKEVILKPDVNS